MCVPISPNINPQRQMSFALKSGPGKFRNRDRSNTEQTGLVAEIVLDKEVKNIYNEGRFWRR